jgi:glycosyltransferase involved in cell wall biosynthesis
MGNEIKILGAAFGDPYSEKVFSGVAKYLFGALEKKNVLTGRISTRQLRLSDVLSGMVDWSKMRRYSRPGLNYAWVWRQKTVEKLSQRVHKLISSSECNTFLQVGTHVKMDDYYVKHYCFTDMTVAQAAESQQFSIADLNDKQIAEAIKVQKEIFYSCSGIFVNSGWVKNSIIKDYGQNADKVHVAGVGASINFSRCDGEPANRHNILFIGRDWNRKGGPVLLEAFKLIRQEIEDASLTIIGCMPNINHPGVSVLGPLNKTRESDRLILEKAFSKAAVFCVPSLYEPFGICFLEAQLYGIVPVTFTGEGRGEAIKDGVTGLLVRERNSKALRDAIVKLFRNPYAAHEMGLAGHEYVTKNFTWDHVAEKVLKAVNEDMQGKVELKSEYKEEIQEVLLK